ncbi:response regulator transcription factor [Nisaea sp.]|uniref:response regulator transcription factor n=1 Tax=Nisaea sp. TaxID=2024842 RepID=UPI003B52D7AF
MHILLVEDEQIVAALMSEILRQNGYRISVAGTGAEMHTHLRGSDAPDLILLDLTLPDEDGIVLARQVRAMTDLPIIVVSGREKLDDRLAALESGVDDYITKPFAPEELLVRIKNLLKRSYHNGDGRSLADSSLLSIGSLRINTGTREVWAEGGGPVELTGSEFDLLLALANAKGRALSRDFLLDAINRGQEPPSSRVVDVLIGRIRKKIEADPRKPKMIRTVTNLGYRLAAE